MRREHYRVLATQTPYPENRLIKLPEPDGQRLADIYRRIVLLASGRYAMLDVGTGFSLVPWKPVIELLRLGQSVAAVVRGNAVSGSWGRQRGPAI